MPEFDLALHTGLRRKSQFALEWSMVDWQARMLHLSTSKTGRQLHIPLNAAALGALRKLYQDRNDDSPRVFSIHKPRHWFDACVKAAGIERFTWHCLRHDFASKLRQRGASLADIAELLGHAGLSMTRRYAHLGPAQLHKVTALLDAPTQEPKGTTAAPETRGFLN